MKVTCEYCDSYVEVSDNNCCPCCGAPLGEIAKAAAEKERMEQQKREDEIMKKQIIGNVVAGVATGLASGLARRHGPGPFFPFHRH